MLILALAIEEAFILSSWLEFGQLCDRRAELLKELSAQGLTPDAATVAKVQAVDGRVAKALENRKRKVSSNLRSLAAFKRTLIVPNA